jgi:hypothetical protein
MINRILSNVFPQYELTKLPNNYHRNSRITILSTCLGTSRPNKEDYLDIRQNQDEYISQKNIIFKIYLKIYNSTRTPISITRSTGILKNLIALEEFWNKNRAMALRHTGISLLRLNVMSSLPTKKDAFFKSISNP